MSGRHQLGDSSLRERTATAVADPVLRANVAAGVDRFVAARATALDDLDAPDDLRSAARAVKADVLRRLPELLEAFADNLEGRGGHVHWADTADDANAYIAGLAQRRDVTEVVKSKSMATEETGLNAALEAAGCRVTETDLGEWIIQLADETPSHIIIPALHRDRHQVLDVFRREADAPDELEAGPEPLTDFARGRLRERFLAADMGITGANFAVAETGSVVLVTNEGNGRMVSTLPRIHVVVLGLERMVADFAQLDLMLNLLARSATGQPLTSYTNIVTGPAGPGEDGPDELHVVILDNGRSDLYGTEFHEMLACIRCGACLNVCPVYRQVGGHAYGWVYSGPMGAVLTPLLASDQAGADELADASTLCGACMQACPVEIPLQDLLLAQRRRNATAADAADSGFWSAWARAWSSRQGYEASTGVMRRLAAAAAPLARSAPAASRLSGRRAPRPPRRSFRSRWKAGEV